MDMIEVDPELFIRCRLCLEDTGLYQIVPIVQEQIKFCFDIEVKLFDGLPQLICKKCKTILSDYFTTKTTFIGKQKTLKTKFEVSNETSITSCDPPQLETVSSSQEEKDDGKKLSKAKKRTRLTSTSAISDDLVEFNRSSSPVLDYKKLKPSCTKLSPAWGTNFRKKIVCVMCQKRFRKKSTLMRHFAKHDYLVSKYHNVFKTYCTVKLNKIDNQPNTTGVLSTVVYGPDKIISNEGKTNYYVIYSPKKRTKTRRNYSDGCESNEKSAQKSIYSDSSDDSMFVKRRQKKFRLLSRSSNETVILDGDNNGRPITSDDEETSRDTEFRNTKTNDTECINIDDSSDSESNKSNMDLRKAYKQLKAKVNELKQIQNITSICHSKYLKKTTDNSVPRKYSESQLKHKILNMGRKVITKQGFNCTGLLRFVENKILEIIWIPTNSTTANANNKDTNYVRIMPKLRGKEQYITDNTGWKFVIETNENDFEEANSEATTDHNISLTQMNSNTINIVPPVVSSLDGSLNGHLKESKSLMFGHVKEKQCAGAKAVDQAVLYTMNADMDTSLKKLLNASPVANPKQLPKKTILLDSKGIVLQTTKQNDVQTNELCLYLDEEDNSDKNLCMPIITSTTSLAVLTGIEKQDNNNINNDVISKSNVTNNSDKCTPRIKVKPVSELMSERVLKNLGQQPVTAPINIWELNHNAMNPVYAENVQSQGNGVSLKTLEIVPIPSSSISTADVNPALLPADREYVILDTAELPNTKTDSPINYFKNLLMIHNIILMDANESVSRDFVCLIKFKLQYKQETVDQPVILYLSFLCAANKFYLGVKYSGQENNIDLNKLPANWQWEILNKIYQDEVVNKVLKNAQKINQTVYDNTNSFLCLLKSIKFKRDI